MDAKLRHSRMLINSAFPGKLKAIFSPQHGLFSEKQDNMKESGHEIDSALAIPVFSLYERSRIPSQQQLDLIDLFVVDLQDVGTRVYTYIWTLLLAMKACAKAGVALAVLDRPNPLGGSVVEGNILNEDLYSFVGMAPVPMRHGLTIGEIATMFVSIYGLDLELHVVRMNGWNRGMLFPDTGLPWVLPSPNMPTFDTALVYPGQVMLEGTNLSEGRGTTRPFEIFGAPYLDTDEVKRQLSCERDFLLREQSFEPTFNKWKGKRCKGFQIHVTNPYSFSPYRLSLDLLSIISRTCRSDFSWAPPPYEYEYEKLPADLIIGNKHIRSMVEQGQEMNDLHGLLKEDERNFLEIRRPWLLY